MGLFTQQPSDYHKIRVGDRVGTALSKEKYDAFDVPLLGLGDLTQDSKETDAIAANFDLVGFSHFFTQTDPQLSVPFFLNEFLRWLMKQLKVQMTHRFPPLTITWGSSIPLYSLLPFFVKFMGDGLLVLFDAGPMDDGERKNIIKICYNICHLYRADFLPSINRRLVDTPSSLRCGIARGKIYSVGNGNDFVGPCINMSSRLLRLPNIEFAFNVRGFDLKKASEESFFNNVIAGRVAIRGIHDGEVIGIPKDNWLLLKPENKTAFRPI